jgi:hypothetical protein
VTKWNPTLTEMAAVESDRCPWCGMPKGHWCTVTGSGTLTRDLHAARLEAVERGYDIGYKQAVADYEMTGRFTQVKKEGK